jgi:predicted NAD/FAD-dependent oxidoreductase
MTTSGPSRRQLLLTFPGPQELDLLRLTASVNKSLTDSKAALCIESASKAYKGYSLQCSQVPTPADIALVCQSIVAKSPGFQVLS